MQIKSDINSLCPNSMILLDDAYIREMIGRLMPSGMYVRPRLEVKIPEITTNKIMDVVIFPLFS